MKKYSKFAVRVVSLILAAVLLIGPLSLGGEANAATPTKGTTTASLLFVRSGAGSNNKIVSSLWRGSSVDILEEKDGWYRIKDGWISAQYVKTDAPAPSVPVAPTVPVVPSTPPVENKTGNATVTASAVHPQGPQHQLQRSGYAPSGRAHSGSGNQRQLVQNQLRLGLFRLRGNGQRHSCL